MRLKLTIAGMCIALAALGAGASEVIDRIVARVNGHIILESDWDDEVAFAAFSVARPPNAATGAERKAALDRLIDRELLREQASGTTGGAGEDEVDARIGEIRKLYPEAKTPEQWNSLLASYGLTEIRLRQRVSEELTILRLVDARLRPTVQIEPASIERYYQQQLLPRLRQQGAKDIPLAEVSDQIKEILTQQKVDELLNAWLQNLRSGSEILTNPSDASESPAR